MRVVKAEEQIGQRGLAGATGADQGHHLARVYCKLDPVQNGFVTVGKMNVVEVNRRVGRAQGNGLGRFADIVLRRQQIENPLAGRARLLKLAVQPDDVFDRAIHQYNGQGELDEFVGGRIGLKGKVNEQGGDADRTEEFYQRSGDFL